ncbi:pyruvate formate lyase 1-activating protein, partial [Citrobacter portucalensis]|nr:pyruvate formate lyase 1-activating protein [Citrobacter portucalensis]
MSNLTHCKDKENTAITAPVKAVIGRIHSFESCGTVDGPGIRFITFFQGCLMRCLY